MSELPQPLDYTSHCIDIHIVSVFTLYQYSHCVGIYIVSVFTLYQYSHCTSIYIVPVFTLYQYSHCTSIYIVPVFTLYQFSHCASIHIVTELHGTLFRLSIVPNSLSIGVSSLSESISYCSTLSSSFWQHKSFLNSARYIGEINIKM